MKSLTGFFLAAAGSQAWIVTLIALSAPVVLSVVVLPLGRINF
jgi:hypothetical protein